MILYMNNRLKTPYFSFDEREITENHSNGLSDNKLAMKVAQPLIDIGVSDASISEKASYKSNLHTTWCHRMTLLIQGEMELNINSGKHQLLPGELSYVPPNTPFSRKGIGPIWWIYFNIDDTKTWSPLKRKGPYIREYDHVSLMFILLRNILDANSSRNQNMIPVALGNARAIANLLLQEVNLANKQTSKLSEQLQGLINEISRTPQYDWKIEEMSSKLNISSTHLNDIFRKQYNMSPHEMVVTQRMLKASSLFLQSEHNMNIIDIAEAVGYKSVYSFSRLFKKYVGLPPAQYRKRHLGKED
jgi:AraC-like DNA-binding protein